MLGGLNTLNFLVFSGGGGDGGGDSAGDSAGL
jgi:hypothetical protein